MKQDDRAPTSSSASSTWAIARRLRQLPATKNELMHTITCAAAAVAITVTAGLPLALIAPAAAHAAAPAHAHTAA
ncbi:hypothetical protein DZF97_15845, partial [Clavibacter nebraskensis]